MNKLFQIITYYSLILTGLIMTSWIVWSRFIRERAIRDVPDALFTEYRFWILLYLCVIYLYIVKNLLKPKEANTFFLWISDLVFTPLITLDHFIKHNAYVQPYYYKVMNIFFQLLSYRTDTFFIPLLLTFQIIPRCILVFFLLLDTFYYNKLEFFYKVVLIGLLPFIFRYLKYSVKDFYDHWVKLLEDKYKFVFVYEKGYKGLISRKNNTLAEYHFKKVSIKECIEIKYENDSNNSLDKNFPYQYVYDAYAKKETSADYKEKKYKNVTTKCTIKDYEEIEKLFHDLIPKIVLLKLELELLEGTEKYAIVKWPKVVIFSLYFVSWAFILSVSYYFYPVTFSMFKYFCINMMIYLLNLDDNFSCVSGGSLRENLITKESIMLIVNAILKKVLGTWF